MSSVNKVILVGRLGKDPESKVLSNGTAVCNFSIATSEKYKDKETTEWHNITMFGKVAEIAQQYLRKGAIVFLEGKIKTESWEKDGEKKYKTTIVCHEMKMLGGRNDNQSSQSSIGGSVFGEEPARTSNDDDLLPF